MKWIIHVIAAALMAVLLAWVCWKLLRDCWLAKLSSEERDSKRITAAVILGVVSYMGSALGLYMGHLIAP